jgi:hypothetical protein
MTKHIELYAKDPKETGNVKQDEFLTWARGRKDRHTGGTQLQAFISGRGGSKTSTAIIDLTLVALVEAPCAATIWTSRTIGEVVSVFIPELKKLVPAELYKYCPDSKNMRIEWASGHITYLRSRYADNANKRPSLGMNVCGLYLDEAATQYDHDKFTDLFNTVRGDNFPFLFVVAISTPLPNAFRNFYHNEECHTTYASSYDNPHLSKENVASMEAQMDELTAQQEIYGKDVITTGRMWDTFVEKPFPEGNIIEDYEFNPELPFFLGVDLGGAQSSIQLYQYITPLHPVTGRQMFQGKLMVMVAEWLANRVGIESVIADIVERYCGGDHIKYAPELVCIGHDVNASTVTGATGAEVFQGIGWKYAFPRGLASRKEFQRRSARAMILNNAGQRRFMIAANKDKNGIYNTVKHMGQNQARGLLDVMRLDTYPDNDDVFNKDKAKLKTGALEDSRDAWLYPVVINHPATLNVNTMLPQ